MLLFLYINTFLSFYGLYNILINESQIFYQKRIICIIDTIMFIMYSYQQFFFFKSLYYINKNLLNYIALFSSCIKL